MNRNAIYNALFELLSKVPGLKTKSMRLLHWSDVPASQQPALFQSKGGEGWQEVKGQPSKGEIDAVIWLYTRETDKKKSPAEQINDLLDKIQAALKPVNGNKQTLGGLVHHCWLAGTVETSEGALGEQEVATFTIKMQVTN